MKRDATGQERGAQGMKYTAGQAAKATGVATATITRALKAGKISGKKDENGSWMIDPSELHRIFPPISQRTPESPSIKQDETPPIAPERGIGSMALEREVQTLRDALNDAREDRDKWRGMAERLSLAPPSPQIAPPRSWWPWHRKDGT